MPWEEVEAWGDGLKDNVVLMLCIKRLLKNHNKKSQYHGQEVSSGRQPTAMRDLRSVSGGMSQRTVLLDGHLDSNTRHNTPGVWENPSIVPTYIIFKLMTYGSARLISNQALLTGHTNNQ